MPNKAQFIEQLADRLDGDRRRAAAALDAMVDAIYAAIAQGEKVAISGFGVFERRARKARTARNPATGASVKVAATRVPAFRPGTEFREIASGARKTAGGSAAKKTAKKAAKKAPAKSSASSSSATKKSAAKKLAAKKSAPASKKAAAKKLATTSPAKKSAAKKTTAKKAAAKKSTRGR